MCAQPADLCSWLYLYVQSPTNKHQEAFTPSNLQLTMVIVLETPREDAGRWEDGRWRVLCFPLPGPGRLSGTCGGSVCGRRDKVALWRGLWGESELLSASLMSRQEGWCTQKKKQKQVQEGKQHCSKHIQTGSSLPGGAWLQQGEASRDNSDRGRGEKQKRREKNGDIIVSVRAVGWENNVAEKSKPARREAKQTTLR